MRNPAFVLASPVPLSLSEETPKEVSQAITRPSSLRSHLQHLASLISNVTEAYTTAIFLADSNDRLLHLTATHSLSRELIDNARIGFGCGLVGWTAENKVRISVCPFEHDATTLLYYRCDQALKSFIALPIFNKADELVGVIACDSKKSYAFPKIAEKLLNDCALQASILIDLHQHQENLSQPIERDTNSLQQFLDSLRNQKDEDSLLWRATDIPQSIVPRDALVIVTTTEEGLGDGTLYSAGSIQHLENRILELVCRHKKIICANRSVQSLPADDNKNRSFLSVPLRALESEAGSFNLLSHPHQAFDAASIAALEQIAAVVSQELERVRLRAMHNNSIRTTGIFSWKRFEAQASYRLTEAKLKNERLDLVRISIGNLHEIEALAGVSIATSVLQRMMRFIDQVKVSPSIACYLYGAELLLLIEAKDTAQILTRLQRLIERLSLSDFIIEKKTPEIRLGKLLMSGLQATSARFPSEGLSLSALIKKTREQLVFGESEKHLEVAVNARS